MSCNMRLLEIVWTTAPCNTNCALQPFFRKHLSESRHLLYAPYPEAFMFSVAAGELAEGLPRHRTRTNYRDSRFSAFCPK